MATTYQWRRCNSSGASCVDIGGATASTYDLVTADVGSRIRVVKTVDGISATSPATSVVLAAGDPAPPPDSFPDAYLYAPLDGSIANPPWLYEASAPQGGDPSASFAWISNSFGQGLEYTIPASGTPSLSSSQLISHFLANGSSYVHTSAGSSTWYRLWVEVPSGDNFVAGSWDWFAEWHNNTGIVPGTVSTAWAFSGGGAGSTSTPASSAGLLLRPAGGPHSAPVYNSYRTPTGFVQKGHVYDIVTHITWGRDSSTGQIEAWIDGEPFPGYTWPQHIPTLLYNSSTNQNDNPAFGIYHYHYKTSYATKRRFYAIVMGSTAAHVGFTP